MYLLNNVTNVADVAKSIFTVCVCVLSVCVSVCVCADPERSCANRELLV